MDEQPSPSVRIERRLRVQHAQWQLSQPDFHTHRRTTCRLRLRKLRRVTSPIAKAIDSLLESTLGSIFTIVLAVSASTWLWSQRFIDQLGPTETPNLADTADIKVWFAKWSVLLLWITSVYLLASMQGLNPGADFKTSPRRPWQTHWSFYVFSIPIIIFNAVLLANHSSAARSWLTTLPFNILTTLVFCRLVGGISIWLMQFANQTYFLMAAKRTKVPLQKILFALAIGIFPLLLWCLPLYVEHYLPSPEVIFPTGTLLTLLAGVANGNWISIILLLVFTAALHFGGTYLRRIVSPYEIRRQIVSRNRVVELKGKMAGSDIPSKPKFEVVDRDTIEALVQKRIDQDCEPILFQLTRNLWKDLVSYPLGNLMVLVPICFHIGLIWTLNSIDLPPSEMKSIEATRHVLLTIFTSFYFACFECKFLFRRIFAKPFDLSSRPISELQAWKSYQFEGLSVSILSSLFVAATLNGQGLPIQIFAVLSVFTGQLAFRNAVAALVVIHPQASLHPKWIVELWLISAMILLLGIFVLTANQIHALVHLRQFKLVMFHTALPLSLALFAFSVWWRAGFKPYVSNWRPFH